MHTYPPVFRAIVVEETCTYEDPKTFQPKTETVFAACALEWYLVGSGDTIEKALDALERTIFSQALIFLEHPDSEPMREAPEDWQRLRNSGDYHLCVDPRWQEFFGDGERSLKVPVVARRDIDMTKTTFKAYLDNKPIASPWFSPSP